MVHKLIQSAKTPNFMDAKLNGFTVTRIRFKFRTSARFVNGSVCIIDLLKMFMLLLIGTNFKCS